MAKSPAGLDDPGGGKQAAGAPLPPPPDGPRSAAGVPTHNPSGGSPDHPPLFEGKPVTPAVARSRQGAAAAHGHGGG